MVHSYDVFNTLIGRLCDGHDIFDIIERLYSLPNFKSKRIQCEVLTKNFDNTYKLLETHYGKNLGDIKQTELDLEYDLSFPIAKYLKNVKECDLLISDMYLSETTIMKMLNKHKLMNNKLLVSYSGKSDSTIWKNKNITSNIDHHFGDHIRSDYQNPIAHGINSTHIADTVLSPLEIEFSKIYKYLGHVMNAVRLSYSSTEVLYKPFIEYVLPFSILVSLKIKQICLKEKIDNVVFLSRDGHWFKEVYNILFPKDATNYIYFSRLLVSNNPKIIKDQINDIKGKKFIFDLQGSGRTFHSLNLNDCFYFMCFLSHDSKLNNYLFKHTAQISNIKRIVEDLFLAPHGSALKYNNNNIILLEPEHDINMFKPYFKGFQLFKDYWKTIIKYFPTNINYTYLDKVIGNFHNDINHQIELCTHINSSIPHVNDHDVSEYKKHPLKFYSQIEQDKYYIENVVKYKPNGTFIEIGGYDGIVGSNTYFLEQNLGWKGIVVECNPELVEKCRQNRDCYICDKALYKNDNEEVKFIIPLGEDIIGGKEQLGGIKETIKNESLHAFQRCYKQSKEITVKTISINTLLEQQKIYEIDYVSLDVEGGELTILQSWDFNKYKIKFITVEHGNVKHYQQDIYKFLTNKGFKLHRHNKWDDEYVL